MIEQMVLWDLFAEQNVNLIASILGDQEMSFLHQEGISKTQFGKERAKNFCIVSCL